MKLEYIVKNKDNEVMVKDIVKGKLRISSRLYRKIIKDILLNGKECYVSNRVKEGDNVTVNLDNVYNKEEMYLKFSPWSYNLNIAYEDEYLLCINKDSGIPCHPSAKHQQETLYNAIVNYYMNRGEKIPIHFVNRLDKDTTGIVIVAKHKYVQEFLSHQMQDGKVNKKYIAVIYGVLNHKDGIIEKRIKRKEDSIILRETTDSEEGEYAKTGYKVIGYNVKKNYTIVEVTLFTGKTHQIRVHFASIGHPLLGDELYAKEVGIDKDTIQRYIKRQALHAKEISFTNVSEKPIKLVVDIPKDIAELL